MKLYVTRDSVAAADDVDAPHRLEIAGPRTEDLGAAIGKILAKGYLPGIIGGQATWTVVSNRPVAVVAQQWTEPRLLDPTDISYRGLDVRDGQLRLHFNYHAQVDPEIVATILWGFRLNAV